MRKIRKLKYSRVFLIIIFAYILLNIFINIIGKNIKTIVIENETTTLKITEKGLIIRDEYLIKSDKSGEIKSIAKEGEKLSKGDTLFAIYNNTKKVEENKNEIDRLNEEIEKLQDEYENSKSSFSKEVVALNIKTKKEQKSVINNENNKNVNYLNMPTSGVVSNKYDGYEDIYTLDRLENLTYKDIEDIENNYTEIDVDNKYIKESDVVARIIKSDYSYIAICTDKDVVFEKNQKVEIIFDNDNIDAIVENIKSSFSKEVVALNIKTKKEQKSVINNENNKNVNYLNMPTSGVVSNKYDGYEHIYTLDKLENLTYKDIEDIENNYTEIDVDNKYIKESDVVARIIKSDYSYIAVCTDKDVVFEKNQKVEIIFDNDNIDAMVENIYINKDYNLVIFKLSNQNIEIYDTRVKEFDIIYKQIDGLKIPKKSIDEVDNQKGVYVLNQQTKKIDFIELKTIQYENDEFIFIDYYKNQREGIKTVDIYDEIILKPNIINTNIKLSRW